MKKAVLISVFLILLAAGSFYNDKYTLFEMDLPNMYVMPEGVIIK